MKTSIPKTNSLKRTSRLEGSSLPRIHRTFTPRAHEANPNSPHRTQLSEHSCNINIRSLQTPSNHNYDSKIGFGQKFYPRGRHLMNRANASVESLSFSKCVPSSSVAVAPQKIERFASSRRGILSHIESQKLIPLTTPEDEQHYQRNMSWKHPARRELTLYINGFLSQDLHPEKYSHWYQSHKDIIYQRRFPWALRSYGYCWNSGTVRNPDFLLPTASLTHLLLQVSPLARLSKPFLSLSPLGFVASLAAQEAAAYGAKLAYSYGQALAHVQQEAQVLKTVLEEMAEQEDYVRVVAHSLGALLLVQALQDIQPVARPREVHLAAPAFCLAEWDSLHGLAQPRGGWRWGDNSLNNFVKGTNSDGHSNPDDNLIKDLKIDSHSNSDDNLIKDLKIDSHSNSDDNFLKDINLDGHDSTITGLRKRPLEQPECNNYDQGPTAFVYYARNDVALTCWKVLHSMNDAVGVVGLQGREFEGLAEVDATNHFDFQVHFAYKNHFAKFAQPVEPPLSTYQQPLRASNPSSNSFLTTLYGS